LRVGYTTMLRAKPVYFFCFYPSLVTFWGTLVANDAKIVHFTFYIYFTGALQAKMFWSHEGATPRNTLVRSRGGPKIE